MYSLCVLTCSIAYIAVKGLSTAVYTAVAEAPVPVPTLGFANLLKSFAICYPFILLFIIYPSATACAIAKFVDARLIAVPVESTNAVALAITLVEESVSILLPI